MNVRSQSVSWLALFLSQHPHVAAEVAVLNVLPPPLTRLPPLEQHSSYQRTSAEPLGLQPSTEQARTGWAHTQRHSQHRPPHTDSTAVLQLLQAGTVQVQLKQILDQLRLCVKHK